MAKKLLIENLTGTKTDALPLWMMRQAGRHLPEYRELRSKNKSFLDFCYAPAAAAAATLQPIVRYDLDAAIIFSDILVIPDALGAKVAFVEGEGPKLEPTIESDALARLNMSRQAQRLAPVYEAIERVRAALSPEKTLLGFAGAPWTLATYMIQGHGGGREKARQFAFSNPDFMATLFSLLEQSVADHLIAQIDAGADGVQLFESWAEDLSEQSFQHWVVGPNARVVEKVRAARPNAPIIGFPRGSSHRAQKYCTQVPVQGFGLDIGADGRKVRADVGDNMCLQGNLDPCALLAGGAALANEVAYIKESAQLGPYIFNLGHGISPQTPIEHVEQLIKLVRS